MSKKFIGVLCIILGSALLSLNLYGLKLLQLIDKTSGLGYWSSHWYYLKEAPVCLSFLITISIIIAGLLIIISDKFDK